MSYSNCVSSVLCFLNLLLQQIGFLGKTGKLVFLGLEFAGKTTLLNLLANGDIKHHIPTLHRTLEQFSVGGVSFQAYDLGGHREARRVWRDYTMMADGLIFLVDASDKSSMTFSAFYF